VVNFVRGVTTAGDPRFVKLDDRIAVFDNDGALWSEQPVPFQFAFSRPIAAFGNSDGALQMLQWPAASGGPRFGLLVTTRTLSGSTPIKCRRSANCTRR